MMRWPAMALLIAGVACCSRRQTAAPGPAPAIIDLGDLGDVGDLRPKDVRPSLPALWKQYWQYGIWKGRLVRRYPASLRPRHLAPSFLVLGLLLAGVAAMLHPLGWIPALALLAVRKI